MCSGDNGATSLVVPLERMLVCHPVWDVDGFCFCLLQGGMSLTWTAAAGAVDYVVKVYQQDAAPTGATTDATVSSNPHMYAALNSPTAALFDLTPAKDANGAPMDEQH